MKRIEIVLMTMLLVFAVTGVANAITFSEVPLLTTDPTIQGVSFWAGDPALYNDTITVDFWTPGNYYLLSGYDDGTGNSPGLYNTFIGANTTGLLFSSFSFDIASEYQLPPSTTLWAIALSSGVPVDSVQLTVAGYSDNSYYLMSLNYANGFDTVYIYDDLDVNGFGEAFHIDNVNFTPYQSAGVPEPSTLILLCSGLAGAWFLKRRKML